MSDDPSDPESDPEVPGDAQAYVAQVMAEIAEEVRLRRTSGDLPPALERELDELFLAHSPVAGRGGDLAEALRMVDAATFIDPVVPVESERAIGGVVKKGMRSLLLWYVGWITHQMSQSASAVSRALHVVDDRLGELRSQLDSQRVPPAPVVEFPGVCGSDSWWAQSAVAAVAKSPGRILHAACGDGWLVRSIAAAGGDVYGVDPRSPIVEAATLGVLDLRAEALADHLRAVAPAGLGAVVLSGIVDGMSVAERTHLLHLVGNTLAPGGTMVLHSVSRETWESSDAPVQADLAPGRPLRPESWCRLLELEGYEVTVESGPDGRDFLVVAVRSALAVDADPPARS